MGRSKTLLACTECRQQVAQWVGRCPGCGAWGTIEERAGLAAVGGGSVEALPLLSAAPPALERPVSTGFDGVDQVLGSGIVPASVVLLAGEPGIGKSTLLLHLMANLSALGRRCLLVSGEESHAQVAARARRLGIASDAVTFAPGRDLDAVLATARATRPFLLAVDSIQTLRDPSGSQTPGGVSQVRTCADALVGLAKTEGTAVLMTGHVTKDGELAGPRTLEHTVDTVLSFEGDPRSGLRVLAGGKNRFGPEGEAAWFEMGSEGLREIDPTDLLISHERVAGAAIALPLAGRRALAVEVQALAAGGEGSGRRQATGLDPRRFQLVAAVVERAGLSTGRRDLFGAVSGGIRLEDPSGDLAVAAALVSAVLDVPVPAGTAFVGEITLTGLVRPAPALPQRLSAARAAGCSTVYAVPGEASAQVAGLRILPVRRLADALRWALPPAGTSRRAG